jgi:hypothetical protein
MDLVMKTMKTKALKNDSDDKVRINVRLLPETKDRLERAKRQLNISETAMIESGLRLYFRQEGVE